MIGRFAIYLGKILVGFVIFFLGACGYAEWPPKIGSLSDVNVSIQNVWRDHAGLRRFLNMIKKHEVQAFKWNWPHTIKIELSNKALNITLTSILYLIQIVGYIKQHVDHD